MLNVYWEPLQLVFCKTKAKGAALTLLATKDSGSALGNDDLLGHKQAQACAIRPGTLGVMSPIKLRKQMMLLVPGHANAVIYHSKFDRFWPIYKTYRNVSAAQRVINSVIYKVHANLAHLGLIQHKCRKMLRPVIYKSKVAPFGRLLQLLD